MIKLLRRAFYKLVLLFILIIAGLYFLVSTTPGLYASIKISALFLPASVEIHQLKGRLLDDFSAGEIIYHYHNKIIKINNLSINWHVKDLVHYQILIKKLSADSITITQGNAKGVINKLLLSGSLPALSMEFTSKLSTSPKDSWQATAKIHGVLPWQWDVDANVLPPQSKDSLLASLHTSLSVQGKIKDLNHSRFRIRLNPGDDQTPVPSIAIPNLGLYLKPIDVTVVSKAKHWEASGTIEESTGKRLILKGKGPLGSKFLAEIKLQGTDFPIVKTQEYQINIAPKLTLNLTPSTVDITGAILVPYAQIKPQTFSNSLTLPDDVIYKSKEKSQSADLNTHFNTSMNVAVEMGNQVELSFKGLHATLAGTVNLKQLPQGPVNANGELTVKKGEYKAYGQDLDIEQGQLFFTGGSLNNPGINLRASKTIGNSTSVFANSDQTFNLNNNTLQNINLGNNIKVGVEVTGRLTEPKVLLFSNPSILSQADILSMLVLGRPASQANKAGGQLLLAAISSMNLGTKTNATQLIEQLKQSIGLDFNVQTNSNYNQLTNQVTDSTAVVIGKALSKRLYLSYNVGLSQADPNVLVLKYLLNQLFSVQVTNSLKSSGIDLLYSRSKDKINE